MAMLLNDDLPILCLAARNFQFWALGWKPENHDPDFESEFSNTTSKRPIPHLKQKCRKNMKLYPLDEKMQEGEIIILNQMK